MKTRWTPPCVRCGRRMKWGNTNGMPNVVSLIGYNNVATTICQQCLIDIGKMTEEQRVSEFKKLGLPTR